MQGAQHLQTVELHAISALDNAIACRILSGAVRLANQKSGHFAPPALAAPTNALDLAVDDRVFLVEKAAERLTRSLMKEYRQHAAGSGPPALTTVWLQFGFPPSRMALLLRPMFRYFHD